MGDEAVREANEGFYQAFNERDIERMRSIWHQGGAGPVVCIHPGWEPLLGYEAILKSWADIFKSSENMNLRVSHVLTQVADDLAWVSCRENLFIIHSAGVHSSQVHASNLFRRVDGAWKMVLHHASSSPPGGDGETPE